MRKSVPCGLRQGVLPLLTLCRAAGKVPRGWCCQRVHTLCARRHRDAPCQVTPLNVVALVVLKACDKSFLGTVGCCRVGSTPPLVRCQCLLACRYAPSLRAWSGLPARPHACCPANSLLCQRMERTWRLTRTRLSSQTPSNIALQLNPQAALHIRRQCQESRECNTCWHQYSVCIVDA